MNTTEFLGRFPSRKIDYKRRLLLPSKLLVCDTLVFVPVQENTSELRLYSYPTWKEMQGKMAQGERADLLKKSSAMQTLDTQKRLLLPEGITWKKVDVIGMLDYIMIQESTG
jgi:DNA-binding transcriptional regulator/RsmH inhibitor MraZ